MEDLQLPETLKLGVFELERCVFNESFNRFSINVHSVPYDCSTIALILNTTYRGHSALILNMLTENGKSEFIFDCLTNKINPEDVVLSINV